MAFKLFIDTNVYLDFLLERGKDWQDAKEIFKLAEHNMVAIFTSSSSLINIMYVMGSYKISNEQIIKGTTGILSYTKLVNPDNITFEIALMAGFKDLEDAVQYHTALEINGVSHFITSNIKDYKNATPLPILTAGAFMKTYRGQM